MELFLILGPMKSGKSLEMIGHFTPLKYTNITFGLYQPKRDVRNKSVWSRVGVEINSYKIDSLKEILNNNEQIVGIDEIHMFEEDDVYVIRELLNRGTKVFVSGLDMDYKGEMFGIIRKILEIGPREVKYKKSVCELCKDSNAVYTSIFKDGKMILEGIPSVVPEDGTYKYVPVCRKCFQKIKNN
jgi:thymidine kinase